MSENIIIESILTSIKKLLGIEDGHDYFDPELVMFINAAFQTLDELGVGPQDAPFKITGKGEEWEDFLTDYTLNLEAVKTYIWIRVKLMFDPPTSSFAVSALDDQRKELEWRLLVQAETGRKRQVVI